MDKQKFLAACAAADKAPGEGGIGTYGRRPSMPVLKLYFERNAA
jgi:hypothetical protein